ncbi:hypothetical protein KC19_VG175600 [Ceratodon purpureus]|uniref:Uncharacterized protein n=1 Tax=Ceratodon purpureus TaxID=3225 RepID=A0A8T0HRJ2_CERPU|nr:hypothetical protein KC19_VG175600 [Ceratodon purpureus]
MAAGNDVEKKQFDALARLGGRTGPLGEVDITERLGERLGRTPAPDEVEEEMTRDKGYSGSSRTENNLQGDCDDVEVFEGNGRGEAETGYTEIITPLHSPPRTLYSVRPMSIVGENLLCSILLRQIEEIKIYYTPRSSGGKCCYQDLVKASRGLKAGICIAFASGPTSAEECGTPHFPGCHHQESTVTKPADTV